MKIRSLLCATIVAAVSANVFALEIYKGKVVSHKEWSTGNGKAIFKTAKQPSSLFANNPMLKTKSGTTHVYSMADSIKGTAGSPSNVTGFNAVYAYNSTNAAVTYYYTYSVCARMDDHTMQCGYSFDQVDLEPEGYISNYLESSMQATFAKPGTYAAMISTNLSSSDDNMSQNSSASGAAIEIS